MVDLGLQGTSSRWPWHTKKKSLDRRNTVTTAGGSFWIFSSSDSWLVSDPPCLSLGLVRSACRNNFGLAGRSTAHLPVWPWNRKLSRRRLFESVFIGLVLTFRLPLPAHGSSPHDASGQYSVWIGPYNLDLRSGGRFRICRNMPRPQRHRLTVQCRRSPTGPQWQKLLVRCKPGCTGFPRFNKDFQVEVVDEGPFEMKLSRGQPSNKINKERKWLFDEMSSQVHFIYKQFS